MKIQISDKKKKDIFVSLFQTLKNCSSLISTKINSEFLHIQGMDKSHVCLFDAKINSTWFSVFELNKEINLSFDSGVFYSIISTKSDLQDLIITMDDDNEDTMHIHFIPQEKESKKVDFKKFFTEIKSMKGKSSNKLSTKGNEQIIIKMIIFSFILASQRNLKFGLKIL